MAAGFSRRRVAAGAAWAVPAVVVASAAPAFAASQPLDCTQTGLLPFPAQIVLYDKDDGQPARINRLPYTANGWTARKDGQVDKGGFSFSNFNGGGFRTTLDPVARAGDEVHTYITALATTIVGCTYTISTTYELSGIGNDRPIAAWIIVDGLDHALINSNNAPVTGSRFYTFTATSTTTTIGLHTRVTGTATANGGVDINMSQPLITCTCP